MIQSWHDAIDQCLSVRFPQQLPCHQSMPVDPAVIALSLGLAPTKDNTTLVGNLFHLGHQDTTPSRAKSTWATPLHSSVEESVALVCDLPPFALTSSSEVTPELRPAHVPTQEYTDGQEMAHLLCGMPPQTQSTAAVWNSDTVYQIPSLRSVLSQLPSPSRQSKDIPNAQASIPEELIGF